MEFFHRKKYVEHSILVVDDNADVHGNNCVVTGNYCNIYGHDCKIWGQECRVHSTAHHCTIFGNGCHVMGDRPTICAINVTISTRMFMFDVADHLGVARKCSNTELVVIPKSEMLYSDSYYSPSSRCYLYPDNSLRYCLGADASYRLRLEKSAGPRLNGHGNTLLVPHDPDPFDTFKSFFGGKVEPRANVENLNDTLSAIGSLRQAMSTVDQLLGNHEIGTTNSSSTGSVDTLENPKIETTNSIPTEFAGTLLTSKAIDGKPTCIVCLENFPNFLAVPCGHKKYCATCAKKLIETADPGKGALCAECRRPVAHFIQVYED
jgi:hypothetical protein